MSETHVLATLGIAAAMVMSVPLATPQGVTPPRPGDYLGQPPPGTTPEVFAPGVVSTGLHERDVAVTPDGDELYFGTYVGRYQYSTILVSRRTDTGWSTPEVAPFSGNPGFLDLEVALSWDGRKLFFLSNRPTVPGGKKGNQDIWVVERTGSGWSQPTNLGPPVNTEGNEYFPSLTRDGTLYFTREEGPNRTSSIFRARLRDGVYLTPERLPDRVNSGTERFNAFIAPDESYLVYSMTGRDDSLGGVDYYIAFRAADDTWSEPVNLGAAINTAGSEEYSPYVSREGKYFFFMSSRPRPVAELFGERLSRAALQRLASIPGNGNADIWWVDASVLQALRPPPAGAAVGGPAAGASPGRP